MRCLGCADTITNVGHQCAGSQNLVPYGGRCNCPNPECRSRQAGAARAAETDTASQLAAGPYR